MPVVLGQAHMTSAETSGTLIVAIQRVNSVTRDGWSLMPFSDGRTTALSVSSGFSLLPVSLNGSAVLGTILGYVFYWIAVIVTLFVLKRRGTLFAGVLGYC